MTRLSDFYKRRRFPSSKIPCVVASAGFAQEHGAEISAPTGLFTDNYLNVVSLQIARNQGQMRPAAVLSIPCLEKSPKV